MSFFEELRRRKVVRVATGYLVAAWIAIQAASIALPAFGAPEWALRAFILMFVLGFPLALMLSWALDITSEGLQPSPRSKSDKVMAFIVLLLIAGAIGWYYRKPPQLAQLAAMPAPTVQPDAAAPASAATTKPPEPATAPAATAPPPPATPPAASAPEQAPAASPAIAAQPQPARPPAAPKPIASPSARPEQASTHRRPEGTEGEHAEISPRCREILQQIRVEMEASNRPRPQMRRERFAAQAQLRNAGCLEEVRQAGPEALTQ